MIAVDLEAKDLVPVLALVFTVASFWWIWLRRGRLTAAPPRFHATASTADVLRIRVPVVMGNSGARHVVIEDLRLIVDGHTLDWITTRKTMRPEPDDWVDFASPFALPGGEARAVVVEFGLNGPSWRPEPDRSYRATIERFTREDWKHLVTFSWWTPPASKMGNYIAHRNRQEPTVEVDPGH